MTKAQNVPNVTVIIPTFNSAETLEECLKSIENQTYRQIEVVVVDNYSEDKTVDIARKYRAKVILQKTGMSEARNVGIKNSSGEIIFSVDSDMKLREEVIEKGVKKIEEGYDAVIIPEISVGKGFWSGVKGLKKLLHLGDTLFESPRMFRRESLERINYYDPKLLDGEDYDVHIRFKEAGFKICYISAIIEHMEGKLTLLEWLQEKYKYGKTTESFKTKHPEWYQKKGKKRLPSIFLRNWRKLLKFPHFAFGLVFFKVIAVFPWKFEIRPEILLPSFMK